jgi:hypothetical protein
MYGIRVPLNCSAEELQLEGIIWRNFERKTKNGTIYTKGIICLLTGFILNCIIFWNNILACLKLKLHEQQNCCNLQQNLISTHVNWKCLHINYKSQGNMCRHFYLTCVEIRFYCKLQQFCCSCNSSLRVDMFIIFH